MMSAEFNELSIKTDSINIGRTFKTYLFEIPGFQRPYSWGEEQLREYWDDINNAEKGLFLGSVVAWVSKVDSTFSDTLSLIDGQQRLTTSMIMLSVIRDSFDLLGEDNDDPELAEQFVAGADAVQGFIRRSDNRGKQHPIMKRSEPNFQVDIQELTEIPPLEKNPSSNDRISFAINYFNEKIAAELNSITEINEKIDFLHGMLEKVIIADIVLITLKNEEDAFLIFETLNTRGLELELADLIKNLLIREYGDSPEGRINIADRWVDLTRKIESNNNNSSTVKEFLWQSWNSRNRYTKQKDMYKTVKKTLAAKSYDAWSKERKIKNYYESYLNDLESDVIVFNKLNNIEISKERKIGKSRNAFSVAKFVDSVRALAIFDIQVTNTFILSIVSKYHSGVMSESDLLRFMRMAECFHFQYNAITQSGSRGGNRYRWNSFAERIAKVSNSKEFHSIAKDLKEKLDGSLPSRDYVIDKFSQIYYAPNIDRSKNTARYSKPLIAYILYEFNKFNNLVDVGINPAHISVEHLIPQSESKEKVDKDRVHSIGNLVLLPKKPNGDLGNSPLRDKWPIVESIVSKNDEIYDGWIAKKPEYLSTEDVQERALMMAEMAVDTIWNIMLI